METINILIDVMTGDKFYTTLKYKAVYGETIEESDIKKFVERKLPTFKGGGYRLVLKQE